MSISPSADGLDEGLTGYHVAQEVASLYMNRERCFFVVMGRS
jgi:hypothetical protein